MEIQHLTGLILVLAGLYSAIKFRYNGITAIKYRKKLARTLSFHKTNEKINESEIIIAQAMYLIGGIIFILIGIAKLFT
jgi:hypothetical protein